MHYQISHTTAYHYSQPVILHPHVVRLRPRSDSSQELQSFSLMVTPMPVQQSQVIDLDGNSTIKLWFSQSEATDSLNIQVLSHVATYRTNPFDYLLEPWANRLPIDYPASWLTQLMPYLGQTPGFGTVIDPIAVQLAQDIHQQVDGNPTQFLTQLNQRIHSTCQYLIRETGEPFPAGLTWSKQAGSCRDLTVLFMEVCRAIGLAARFVSGYHEADPDNFDQHLHAWAEVYLPGAGWRGFDPVQGIAAADRHIALVASAFPAHAAPISGSFNQSGVPIQSTLKHQLMVQALS